MVRINVNLDIPDVDMERLGDMYCKDNKFLPDNDKDIIEFILKNVLEYGLGNHSCACGCSVDSFLSHDIKEDLQKLFSNFYPTDDDEEYENALDGIQHLINVCKTHELLSCNDIDDEVWDKLRNLYMDAHPGGFETTEKAVHHLIQMFASGKFFIPIYTLFNKEEIRVLVEIVELIEGTEPIDFDENYKSINTKALVAKILNFAIINKERIEEMLTRPEYETTRVGIHSDGSTIWVNDAKGCIIRIGNIREVINSDNHMTSFNGVASESKHMIDISIDR